MTGHPRVISIPAPLEVRKAKRHSPSVRWSPRALAASAVVLVLMVVCANSIWTYVSSTATTLRIDGETFLADDMTRAARAEIATTVMVQETRNEWAKYPGGLVLAFRSSDIGYYSGLPFLSNLDTGAVPFLEIEDPEQLWEKLRENDIRLVLQPGYPWPEVNNTAFDALLADPHYATLITARDGMRLLRIRTDPSEPAYIVVGQEGEGSNHPLNTSEWKAWSWPTSDVEPVLSQRWPDAPISVNTPHRFFRDRERWDYTERGIPDGTAAPAFVTRDGALVIDMDIEGRGRVDVYAVHLGANASTGETLIWSGTLLGERRTIAGQMAVPQDAIADTQGRRHMGLRLRTFRSEGLTIHGWRARWLPSSTPTTGAPRQLYVQEGPAERAAQFESRVLSGRANVTLNINANPLPTRALAVCSQGEIELALVGNGVDRAEAQDVPCWPRALILEWAPGSAAPATVAQVRVVTDDAPAQTASMVLLQDELRRLAQAR